MKMPAVPRPAEVQRIQGLHRVGLAEAKAIALKRWRLAVLREVRVTLAGIEDAAAAPCTTWRPASMLWPC